MFPIRPDDLLFVQLSDVMRGTAFILRSSNPLRGNSRRLLRQLSEQRTIFGRSFPQISRAWTMVTMPRRKEIARQKLMPRSPIPNSVRVRSASVHTGCLIRALRVHMLWESWMIESFRPNVFPIWRGKIDDLLIGSLVNRESRAHTAFFMQALETFS